MAEPQLATAATGPSIFDEVAALPKPLYVHMDKSRDFASVHGERAPNDPHADVFFFQDGLPFNSRGMLLWDHPDVQNNPKLKAKAEKLVRRALKLRLAARDDESDEDDEDEEDLDKFDDDEDDGPEPVNLTEWAAGKDYPWQEVSNAIARRYVKRVNNRRDAVELLVEQKAISIGALSKAHRKLLDAG